MLEASWKQAPAGERELWRGLAQVAVGLTHVQRGNARGAVALLRRGAERVGGYAGRGAARHRRGRAARGRPARWPTASRRAGLTGLAYAPQADPAELAGTGVR